MTALTQGFTNPVLDCQSCYRAVLDAMSRPALPVRLPVLPPLPVPGGAFGSGMAALALTLCDGETRCGFSRSCAVRRCTPTCGFTAAPPSRQTPASPPLPLLFPP